MSEGKELAGKVAVVTGAGRNIGRAIALELAAAGATVAVNARRTPGEIEAVATEIERGGGRALAVLADVTDEAAVGRLAKTVGEKFGRIDILVNNAAVRRETDFEAIALSEWREILSIILDGAFLMTKACLPWMKAGREGAVINIGGMAGHLGAKRRPHAIAAKSGLVGLTKALAHDLAEHGITANCVVPGLIDTVRGGGTSVQPGLHAHLKPLAGRPGKPAEIAAAVRYLAGPGARFVTGQQLHVNGGLYMG
ncbi:MAG: SDR family oxidoreductase [Alphaproteobacteria bacterium]|nr:SDR family oxidoreductase [Alphaproteobacteria bacterium]